MATPSQEVLKVDDVHAFRDWAAENERAKEKQRMVESAPPATTHYDHDDVEWRVSKAHTELEEAERKLARETRILKKHGVPECLKDNAFWNGGTRVQWRQGGLAEDKGDGQEEGDVEEDEQGDSDGESGTAGEGPSPSEAVERVLYKSVEEAEEELQVARELITAGITDTKAVTPYGNERSAYVMYELSVDVAGHSIIKSFQRYSFLCELHEYLSAHPLLKVKLPEFPPKSYMSWLTGATDGAFVAKRKSQLCEYYAQVFVNPIIVMSKYLRMRLEVEPEAAEKLLYFGKYLAALERQLEVVRCSHNIKRLRRRNEMIEEAWQQTKEYSAHTPTLTNVLQYSHPMVFGFPESMRSSPIFGPNGCPWFMRTIVTSWFGNRKSSTLTITSTDDTTLLTLTQFEEESRTFTASLPSSVEQSNDAALYRVEMKKEQTLFQAAKVLITMHDGSLIKCKSVVEDYVFHSADDTPVGCLSSTISLVEDTRGVQVEASISPLVILGAVCCIDYWNSPFVLS